MTDKDDLFDEEEVKDLKTLIQLVRDWRAWDKLRQHIAATIKWAAAISAFLIVVKDPLIKWLEKV